ncbi:MAG: ribosome biogenesis GTPase YlqF [Erysipelotrichaceae bacterium]
MYQKKIDRQNKSIEEKNTNININWFPGHMTKAKREMQEKLKLVDMVIELRDARIPVASTNPLLAELTMSKPRLIILSKRDKANNEITKAWIKTLESEFIKVIALDLLKDNIQPIIMEEARHLMKNMIERQIKRGIKPRAIRSMVVGIPNVGKSTFINRMAKRKALEAADRPGVTKNLRWVKVDSDLELLDTPGVLWPKFDDPTIALHLAITGAIRDSILPLEEVAYGAMKILLRDYPNLIKERFKVDLVEDPYQMICMIGEKRGFKLKDNEIDEKRTIEMFLREIRSEKIGAISWEKP